MFSLYALPCRTVVRTRVHSRVISCSRCDLTPDTARRLEVEIWMDFFALLRLDETKINPRIIRELFRGPLRLIEPVVLAQTWIAKNAWTVERRNNFRSHVARFRTSLSLLARIFFSGRRSQSLVFPFFSRSRSGYFLLRLLLSSLRYPISSLGILEGASERYPRANSLFPFRYCSRLSNRVWLNRV